MAATDRPLRADAERNRRALLDAAAELFATKGLSVGLNEIAHHAGIGVATAYRRFPDKDGLIRELFTQRLDELAAIAEAAAQHPDAWSGLAELLERSMELQARNRGLKELVFSGPHGAEFVEHTRSRIKPIVDHLVQRAQQDGTLRPDIGSTDIPLAQLMLGAVAEFDAPPGRHLWRRYLRIMLDGLRTPDPTPLDDDPLSAEELERVLRSLPHSDRGT